MKTNENGEITLKIPKDNVFLNFSADCNMVKHFIREFVGDHHADYMEEYLRNCKNRQQFFILISDDAVEWVKDDDNEWVEKSRMAIVPEDFINKDEMEL